jgi:hypothetical protein
MTIWKSKDAISESSSSRQKAGDKQERDVAFYLRRAFKDSSDYIVFNDYPFSYNNEKAQIDHLIIHRYGFIILESKSIYGEVKVNNKGEWSRSYKGQWSGIPSPIKQANLQSQLFKEMMAANVEEYLGKFLFGVKQQGIGGRKWDLLCAVSNSCILHRDNIPNAINGLVIKSEGVSDAIRAIGDKNIVGKVFGSDPAFSEEEMINIADFVQSQALSSEQPKITNKTTPADTVPDPLTTVPTSKSIKDENKGYVSCKKCGEPDRLEGQYGKYGYYVKCIECGTNTSMKQACARCGNKKVKLSKKKGDYLLTCECSEPYVIFSK